MVQKFEITSPYIHENQNKIDLNSCPDISFKFNDLLRDTDNRVEKFPSERIFIGPFATTIQGHIISTIDNFAINLQLLQHPPR